MSQNALIVTCSEWKQDFAIDLKSAIYTIPPLKCCQYTFVYPAMWRVSLRLDLAGPVCNRAWWRAERDGGWIYLPAVVADLLLAILHFQAHSIPGGVKSDVGCYTIST